MKKIVWLFILGSLWLLWPVVGLADTSGIINTKHNLSVTGPGPIHALTETRICVFCHTPHNATPSTPLWNRDLSSANYQTYSSTTFNVSSVQPSGPSRLCLSCHDGTIALGAVKSVTGDIDMNGTLTGRSTLLGTDLRDDHPFSLSYADGLAKNPELEPTLPSALTFYPPDVIHCTTCHNPHDDTYGMFLAVDNKNAALCTLCHAIPNWSASAHATSSNTWNGSGNDPWPVNDRLGAAHARTTVAENGCENCHTPHNAGGPQRLLNYREEENNCTYACHNGNLGGKDIAAQFTKISSHPLTMAAIGDVSGTPHDPAESVLNLTGHVECQDCHDQHTVNHNSPAVAPNVSGLIQGVKGIDTSGAVVSPAIYEYEICLKCHGDSSPGPSTIVRYSNQTNRRLDMATSNPSYHPVFGIGKNDNVPSLPSAISPDPGMNTSSMIYCTDCHDSDETSRLSGAGPVGPHGSIYAPLLREKYTTLDGTTESYAAYALCYRCHDRASILSDVSFKHKGGSYGPGGHSGHLEDQHATCSTCHDPHGVVDDGVFGSHTHLINFDTAVVSPYPGNAAPIFTDKGLYTGSCTLVCHGSTHTDITRYTYP